MSSLYGVFRFRDDLTYPDSFAWDEVPALFAVNLETPLFYVKVAGVYKPYYGIEALVSSDRTISAIYYYNQDGGKTLYYAPGVDGFTWDGWWADFYRTLYAPNNLEINEYLVTWFVSCLERIQKYPSKIKFYYRALDGSAVPTLYKETSGNILTGLVPLNSGIPELDNTQYENYVVLSWKYYDGYTSYGNPMNGDVLFEDTSLIAEIIGGEADVVTGIGTQGYVGNIMGWGVNREKLERVISRFFSGNFGDIITGLELSELILGAYVFPFEINVFTNVACEHANPITAAFTTIWEPDGNCGRLSDNNDVKELGKIYPRRFYNDFRDYLNDIYIYLPYLGFEKIPSDIFYRHDYWKLRLTVDLFNGKGCYYIEHDGDQYGFWGVQIGLSIPIIKTDYNSSLRNSISNVVASIGTLGFDSSNTKSGDTAIRKTGSVGKVVDSAMDIISAPNIGVKTSAGDFSQSAMPRNAFVRYFRTVTNNIDNIEYYGRVCKQSLSLNRLSGYAEIEDIHLENINATQDELDEIVSLLKSGVVF